jgi:glycosyltransferase involved in cell wall biosynthesis
MTLAPLDPAAPLTAVILTRDEEKHIARCIRSIRGLCAKIVVIDSESTDRTREIATELGATVFVRPWPGQHADQMNFGIDRAGQQTAWLMRIDADEYLTPELYQELEQALSSAGPAIGGMILPRRVMFQEHAIRFGGFYPQLLLRVWRAGQARCEQRLMDEHMVLSGGKTRRLKNDLVDHNLNDIFWWTEKHNRYARREAAELVELRYRLVHRAGTTKEVAGVAGRKRFIKEKIYSRLPRGLRALLYFTYRFVFRLGFLDHPRVWVFHFLQAAWYRTLVDVMVGEFEDAVGEASREEQVRFLRERWGIKLESEPCD